MLAGTKSMVGSSANCMTAWFKSQVLMKLCSTSVVDEFAAVVEFKHHLFCRLAAFKQHKLELALSEANVFSAIAPLSQCYSLALWPRCDLQ